MGDNEDKMMAREQLAGEMQAQQMMQGIQQQQAMVEQAIAKNVMSSLQIMEDEMDKKIQKLSEVSEMGEQQLDDLREQRKLAMRKQAEKRQEWKASGHGEYREVRGEKDFFQEVKGSERVVIHFFRSSSIRCNIIDRHLSDLAMTHMETKFIKIDAEKSPFLVERLNIWMMPSIVIALNGKTEHTITGLDEFGGTDDFTTEMAAYVLGKHKAIFHDGVPPENPESSKKQVTRFEKAEKTIRTTEATLDEDDDWWD